jgi:hypothetical protein
LFTSDTLAMTSGSDVTLESAHTRTSMTRSVGRARWAYHRCSTMTSPATSLRVQQRQQHAALSRHSDARGTRQR